MRQETVQRLASEVIALLEKDGVRATFDRFVKLGTRPLRHNGVPYRGGNVLALWGTAITRNYTSPYWMTFAQALALGACVRKGETSTVVCYVDKWVPQAERANEDARARSFLKAFCVFNAGQIDGLPEKYTRPAAPGEAEPIAGVEEWVRATGAQIIEDPIKPPHYRIGQDVIAMPPRALYHTARGYYADVMHELVHWTGPRVKREVRNKWRSAEYAYEELVAEIGSAFLCVDLGLGQEVERNQAPYLADWLTVLKNDPTQLWTAAKQSDVAVEYLHGLTIPMQEAA